MLGILSNLSMGGGSGTAATVFVATRNYACDENPTDNILRFIDPRGSFFNGTKSTSATAAVVTCQTAQNLMPTVGQPTSVVFTSTQRGFWQLASNVPGATTTESADGLTFTVTYTPAATHKHGIYIIARCVNKGNMLAGFPSTGVATCLQAPGARGIVTVGSGMDYPTLRAAFDYVKSLSPSNGYCIVVKNGTYTGADDFIYKPDNSTVTTWQPPAGEWTQSGTDADGNPLYTIDRWTSVMAQTPFGVILDGQGTKLGGVYLYGSTARRYEEATNWNFGNAYPLSEARRGIYCAGFVVKRTIGAGWLTQYCDNIKFEYGMTIDSSYGLTGYNNSQVQFQNSYVCVAENMHSLGGGRYNVSCYQASDLRYRRCTGQLSYLNTFEPHAAFNLYRSRRSRYDNCLAAFSKLGAFNQLNAGRSYSIDGGLCLISATDVHSYPRDLKFNRILGFNVDFGGVFNDAYDVGSTYNSDFTFTDCGQWYYKPDNRGGGGVGVAQAGPNLLTRYTSVYCDDTSTAVAFYAYAHQNIVNNSILYKYGHAYDGAANNTATSRMYYQSGTTTPNVITDTYIYDDSTPLYDSTNGGLTETRINTTTDPSTIGMRYPGRIEAGSALKTAGIGQDNVWLAVGPRLELYGSATCDDETGENWVAQLALEYAIPFYRSYDYTGTPGTNSGNRGWAKTTKFGIDCILAQDIDDGNGAKDVPFPLDVTATQISATVVRISWRLFASDYMSNITGWKIYIDGGHADTAGQYDHSVDFTGLVPGRVYVAQVSAVDSVFGESGLSYEVEFTA